MRKLSNGSITKSFKSWSTQRLSNKLCPRALPFLWVRSEEDEGCYKDKCQKNPGELKGHFQDWISGCFNHLRIGKDLKVNMPNLGSPLFAVVSLTVAHMFNMSWLINGHVIATNYSIYDSWNGLKAVLCTYSYLFNAILLKKYIKVRNESLKKMTQNTFVKVVSMGKLFWDDRKRWTKAT